ncbi:hypothetical protein [Bradyrhizobium sp. Ash2021]|uniref:hypothetical protein n=1 Tax=Bradyrhizobium sp. Ash2021 TaxID=2954771 RepID=UPI0028150AEC|nr:hypothetical protein [Bradyrhizobium sp. Ash2021]WMT77462.1 hypothetical protein NL528_14380 [Bradyrhizobium sp. Ash2021]
MTDADFHWSEYIKAGSEALVLLKALYPLLPRGGAEIEAKIEAAERALQAADVALAKGWGYELHDCTFPPQIMLYDKNVKDRVCKNCGFSSGLNRPLPRGPRGGSWMSA